MCYARAYLWSEPEIIKIYKNLPEKIENEIKNLRIIFPFYISQITDPLQPVPEIKKLTFRIVKMLINYRLSFRIVTKSAEGTRELIKEIPELIIYPYWFLEMTIESTPEKQHITSPNASKIIDRILTLKFLNDLGIETVCRTDPTILGIIENEDLLWLLERIKKTGVRHIIASTGYYNKVSMENLLSTLRHSKFKSLTSRVIEYYQYDPKSLKNRFMAKIEMRKKFHKWFRQVAEDKGFTYAVCQELPKEYDSPDLPTCEGSSKNRVHIQTKKNNFVAIDCFGDCLRSCPNLKNPPCRIPELAKEYPYNIKTIQRKPASLFD